MHFQNVWPVLTLVIGFVLSRFEDERRHRREIRRQAEEQRAFAEREALLGLQVGLLALSSVAVEAMARSPSDQEARRQGLLSIIAARHEVIRNASRLTEHGDLRTDALGLTVRMAEAATQRDMDLWADVNDTAEELAQRIGQLLGGAAQA